MSIDHLSNLAKASKLCLDFQGFVANVFFPQGPKQAPRIPDFCWSLPYQQQFKPIKLCIQLCQMLRLPSCGSSDSVFYRAASTLDQPRDTSNWQDFITSIDVIRVTLETARDEILAFCSSFDEIEKERINEAIHCYFEDCNYACVAMSVSATESRLLKLMCLASPESKKILEKKTLGELISEYLENKVKYKEVVPEKHEYLLKLCNTYRIFSVHPKKEEIRSPLTSSILNLTIEFLTDSDTKPEVIQTQLNKDSAGN
jgi:hypothetical protein